MDRIAETAFFEILRASVWQREPAKQMIPCNINYEELITEFRSHALLGVVADTIASYCPLTESQRDNIFKYMGNMVRKHWELDNTISDLFRLLQDADIKPILLKGQGLSRLYPMANTRSVGDIDIYIGKKNYTKACQIIDEYCGIPKREISIDANNIHGSAKKEDIDIEIHYLAADTAIPAIKDKYNALMDNLLLSTEETVDIHGREIFIPSIEVNLVYVFEHLLKHLRYEGVGFRQFIDWMLLINQWRDRGAKNEEWLRNTLTNFHLMDAWQVLGGILVYQLGMSESAFPFWEHSKARHSQGRNLKYIMDSENLGHGTAKSKGYYYMEKSWKRRMHAVLYYARFMMFEYRLFPYDTISKFLHRRFKY